MLSTDPQCLLTDDDGDLDISGGRSKFASGLTASAQQADARIEIARGELFWRRTIGFPIRANAYVSPLDAVTGEKFSAARTDAALREALLLTPNAKQIEKLAVNFDRRARKISAPYRLRIVFDDTSGEISGEA